MDELSSVMVRDLDTGELVPIDVAAAAAVEKRVGRGSVNRPVDRGRPSPSDEQMLLPSSLVPTITKLTFSGSPFVGASVHVEPFFSISGCTHATRWRRLRGARDKGGESDVDEPIDGFVGATDNYVLTADDLGHVLVAEVTPVGPTGARGLSGTATSSIVSLAPSLRVQLVAAVARASAYFEMELPARAAVGDGLQPTPQRPVRLLLGADGISVRTLSKIAGTGRDARQNAILACCGFSATVRVRAPSAEPRKLLLVLAPGVPPLELLTNSPEERTIIVLTVRAFACLGSPRSVLGSALWPQSDRDPSQSEGQVAPPQQHATAGSAASAALARVHTPCVGGHASFSGQPLVGSTLFVHLPPAPPIARIRAHVVSPSGLLPMGQRERERDGAGRRERDVAPPRSESRALHITWSRSRANAPPLAICKNAYPIDGMTGVSYTLTADDLGCFVYADVTPSFVDGTVGISAHVATPAPVGLSAELSARMASAREADEAKFSVIDLAALATQVSAHARSSALAKTMAASRLGQGEPPTADRTLLLNSRKAKLRFGRRTLVKAELTESTDARIVGASEAQTAVVAAAIASHPADSAYAAMLKESVPLCVRMSSDLAFDLLLPTARERDAAVLILRLFARERCEQLGLAWSGAQNESGEDDEDDSEGEEGRTSEPISRRSTKPRWGGQG